LAGNKEAKIANIAASKHNDIMFINQLHNLVLIWKN